MRFPEFVKRTISSASTVEPSAHPEALGELQPGERTSEELRSCEQNPRDRRVARRRVSRVAASPASCLAP